MTKKLSRLDSLQIPQPCTVGWEQMLGDEQIRFCNECNKQVYNLSAMTARQAEALIEASRGRLCARITRQPDGTTLVADDFIVPAAKLHHLRRASPLAGAVVTALLAVSPVMAAQTTAPAKPSASALEQSGEPKPGTQTQEGAAKIIGKVLHAKGSVANAEVTLIELRSGDLRGTIAKDDGTFEFDMLKPALYAVKVAAAGFASTQTNVSLQQNQQQIVNMIMQDFKAIALGGAMAVRQQPLRTLYDESDLIISATAGNSVKVESERATALMKTALNVMATLKGRTGKSVVYVYHWVYQDREEVFARDKKQLVFLKHSKRGKDGYEVDDLNYGLKKLSDADLTIYTQRINELTEILQAAKPDEAQIVEWLVRCAEEKVTRSEGLMELLQSFRQLSYDEEEKSEEQIDEEAEEGEAEMETGEEAKEAEEIEEPEEVEEEAKEYLKITAHLTQGHKERVLAILYSTEIVTDEEENLIELAKIWKDARLAPYLVAQLRRMEDAPTIVAETIINHLVELLANEKIEEAAKEYIENVSYENLEVAEEEDEEKKVATADARSQTPEALKAIQQRSERLKKLLALMESKINK